MSFLVLSLASLSVANAFYTFFRRKHYRLFEKSVETVPSTPSARRVRVDSTPVSSSPLRFLGSMVQPLLSSSAEAEARSYPDAQRDVWEVTVWDPLPINLRLFCYFSPGHVLAYMLFLPASEADPRPSVAAVTAVAVGILLSIQLSLLQSSFSQQSKDSSLIHREVLHEYDAKFVNPRLYPAMRDVGTQFDTYGAKADEHGEGAVFVYPARSDRRKSYQTNPNMNYAKHFDPDGLRQTSRRDSGVFGRGNLGPPASSTPNNSLATPSIPQSTPSHFSAASGPDSSPLRRTAIRQPGYRSSLGSVPSDGGSMGVLNHANSPLKRNSSSNFANSERLTNRGLAAMEQRAVSPLKRSAAASERRRESGRF
jgi:hypothetical protein